MQPTANIIARADIVKSAPWMMRETMSTPLATLPDAPILIRSRSPTPTRPLCTSIRPSVSGMPTWSSNSCGAAPVPPSEPSTMTKSGVTPVASMPLQMDRNSVRAPTQSLKPTGLPPESRRSVAMNAIISHRRAERRVRGWRHHGAALRHAAGRGDLRAHLGAGQHTAQTGFGALRQLDRDRLHRGQLRLLGEFRGVEVAVARRGSRSTPNRSPRSGRRRRAGDTD